MFPMFNSPPPAPAHPSADSSVYKSCSCSCTSKKTVADQPTSFPQTRGRLDADYAAYSSKGGAIVNCPEPPRAIIAQPVVRCPAPERLSRPTSPVRTERRDEQPKPAPCSYPPQAPAKWYDDTVTPTASRPPSPRKRQCEDSPALSAKRMCMKKKAASAASANSSRAASRVTSPVAEAKDEKPAVVKSETPAAATAATAVQNGGPGEKAAEPAETQTADTKVNTAT